MIGDDLQVSHAERKERERACARPCVSAVAREIVLTYGTLLVRAWLEERESKNERKRVRDIVKVSVHESHSDICEGWFKNGN